MIEYCNGIIGHVDGKPVVGYLPSGKPLFLIAGGANETRLADMNDGYFAAYIASRILQEARPLNVSWLLFRSEGPQASNIMQFPIQDDPGAAAASTEGTGLSNTQLTTSNAQATAGTVGMAALVTDELQAAMIADATDQVAGVLGRSVAEKIEVDHSALYGAFSNVVGSTGTDFTVIQYVTALNGLLTREAVGQPHTVLHTQQLLDLQVGSGNTPGGVLTALASSSNFYANPNMDTGIMDNIDNLSGYQGTLLGGNIFVTTAVGTANAGADRAGASFVSDALGRYEVWAPRVEPQRQNLIPGTSLAGTARYGVVEIRDAWGTSIITDA